MKCVMIIDPSLPVGIMANTAASLGISLAGTVQGLVGPDVVDADLHSYRGYYKYTGSHIKFRKQRVIGKMVRNSIKK
jgi:hypothetical protein